MEEITTVGVDLAKSTFQVHAVDHVGKVVVQEAFNRRAVIKFFDQLPPWHCQKDGDKVSSLLAGSNEQSQESVRLLSLVT